LANRCASPIWLDLARKYYRKGQTEKCAVLLPVDCVIAKSPMADAEVKVCGIKEIPEDWMGWISDRPHFFILRRFTRRK